MLVSEEGIAMFAETMKVFDDYFVQSQMCRLNGIYSGSSHYLVMRRWTNLYAGLVCGRRAAISEFGKTILFVTKLLTSVTQVIFVARFLEQEGNPILSLKDRKGAEGG